MVFSQKFCPNFFIYIKRLFTRKWFWSIKIGFYDLCLVRAYDFSYFCFGTTISYFLLFLPFWDTYFGETLLFFFFMKILDSWARRFGPKCNFWQKFQLLLKLRGAHYLPIFIRPIFKLSRVLAWHFMFFYRILSNQFLTNKVTTSILVTIFISATIEVCVQLF